MALVLSGRKYSRVVKASLRQRVDELQGQLPGLTVIIVGENPASRFMLRQRKRHASRSGLTAM